MRRPYGRAIARCQSARDRADIDPECGITERLIAAGISPTAIAAAIEIMRGGHTDPSCRACRRRA
jgi:hypothetical protein